LEYIQILSACKGIDTEKSFLSRVIIFKRRRIVTCRLKGEVSGEILSPSLLSMGTLMKIKDTFMTIRQAARKLKVRTYDYIRDRVSG